MGMLVQVLFVFVVSVVVLYFVVKLFGSSEADFKTVLMAALIMTIVNFPLSFIPAVGWILSLIVNIIIVMSVMECSAYVAVFALIIWSLLTGVFAGSILAALGF